MTGGRKGTSLGDPPGCSNGELCWTHDAELCCTRDLDGTGRCSDQVFAPIWMFFFFNCFSSPLSIFSLVISFPLHISPLPSLPSRWESINCGIASDSST